MADPVGWIIARPGWTGDGLTADWDASVHTTEGSGRAELEHARAAGLDADWQLYALIPVRRPTAVPS